MSFKVNIVLQLDFLQKSLCIFFCKKKHYLQFRRIYCPDENIIDDSKKRQRTFFKSIVAKKCTMSRQQYVAKCKKMAETKLADYSRIFFSSCKDSNWQNYSFSALIPFRPFRLYSQCCVFQHCFKNQNPTKCNNLKLRFQAKKPKNQYETKR